MEINRAESLNRAFDSTGITWHDRSKALAAFTANHEIVYEGEEPFVLFDSEIQPLSDGLKKWAYDTRNPELFDGRSLPRTGAGLARPGLASKADYPTTAEKIAAINLNGADWWERLPLRGLATSEVKTFEDWEKLPRAEKVRRVGQDPEIVSKLIAASGKPAGSNVAKINHPALAKELATRGKR